MSGSSYLFQFAYVVVFVDDLGATNCWMFLLLTLLVLNCDCIINVEDKRLK